MAGPWAEPFKNREELKKALDPMGRAFHICWLLGAAFAVLGVIGDAMNATLGLEPMIWVLLAIAAFLAGIPMLVTWALALRLLGIEGKEEDK